MPDDCIEWTRSRNDDGYGHRWDPAQKKVVLAHRFAMAERVGWPELEGKSVMHTCDNPPCINPDHLRIGTHAENMADMTAKGRRWMGGRNGNDSNLARGAAHYLAKVTAEQVTAIRADTRRQADIAADYGITQSTVSKIKRRTTHA